MSDLSKVHICSHYAILRVIPKDNEGLVRYFKMRDDRFLIENELFQSAHDTEKYTYSCYSMQRAVDYDGTLTPTRFTQSFLDNNYIDTVLDYYEERIEYY